eukprot:1736880-Pleurochrysis_carterae.AAC.1
MSRHTLWWPLRACALSPKRPPRACPTRKQHRRGKRHAAERVVTRNADSLPTRMARSFEQTRTV